MSQLPLVQNRFGPQRAQCEPGHAVAKRLTIRRRQQTADARGGDERVAIEQHDMASHAPLRIGFGEPDGFVERQRVRHQRGRRNNSTLMSLDDRPVDARSQAKVVSIHNESAHA